MLLDQWRERRQGFQAGLVLRDAVVRPRAPAPRRSPPPSGWSEPIYRVWYLTGAVWTAGWLGLGTAFLLGRTRFGYTYAVLLLLSGLVALMIRNSPTYAGAGPLPLLYLIGAVILALAIGVETYFQNPRWPRFAAGAIVGVTILSLVLMVADAAAAGARLRASTRRRASRSATRCPATSGC